MVNQNDGHRRLDALRPTTVRPGTRNRPANRHAATLHPRARLPAARRRATTSPHGAPEARRRRLGAPPTGALLLPPVGPHVIHQQQHPTAAAAAPPQAPGPIAAAAPALIDEPAVRILRDQLDAKQTHFYKQLEDLKTSIESHEQKLAAARGSPTTTADELNDVLGNARHANFYALVESSASYERVYNEYLGALSQALGGAGPIPKRGPAFYRLAETIASVFKKKNESVQRALDVVMRSLVDRDEVKLRWTVNNGEHRTTAVFTPRTFRAWSFLHRFIYLCRCNRVHGLEDRRLVALGYSNADLKQSLTTDVDVKVWSVRNDPTTQNPSTLPPDLPSPADFDSYIVTTMQPLCQSLVDEAAIDVSYALTSSVLSFYRAAAALLRILIASVVRSRLSDPTLVPAGGTFLGIPEPLLSQVPFVLL